MWSTCNIVSEIVMKSTVSDENRILRTFLFDYKVRMLAVYVLYVVSSVSSVGLIDLGNPKIAPASVIHIITFPEYAWEHSYHGVVIAEVSGGTSVVNTP